MKHKTLILGSLLAVGIFAVIVCAGMVTGYSVEPSTSAGPLSDTNTGTVTTDIGQYIQIDPVGDRSTGDLLTITGSTNLPAGTTLMVGVANTGGNVLVRAGTGGVNRYSDAVDTTAMKPGTKTITVNNMVGNLEKGDYRPGTVNATASFILKGAYQASDTPEPATVPVSNFIRIDAIGDRSVSEQFLITGTTSLPVGSMVIWQISPDTGTPPTGTDKNALGIAANAQVTKGDGISNRVSLAVDMHDFKPGKWVALVGEMKGDPSAPSFEMTDLTGYAYFNLK
jgi:hypothetical protein